MTDDDYDLKMIGVFADQLARPEATIYCDPSYVYVQLYPFSPKAYSLLTGVGHDSDG